MSFSCSKREVQREAEKQHRITETEKIDYTAAEQRRIEAEKEKLAAEMALEDAKRRTALELVEASAKADKIKMQAEIEKIRVAEGEHRKTEMEKQKTAEREAERERIKNKGRQYDLLQRALNKGQLNQVLEILQADDKTSANMTQRCNRPKTMPHMSII